MVGFLRVGHICRISNPRFIEIGSASLLIQPYKVLFSVKNFYAAVIFSNFSIIFIAHFARACVNPRILFSDFHFMYHTCLSINLTHSFIDFGNQTCTNLSPMYTVQVKQSSGLQILQCIGEKLLCHRTKAAIT